ncbi:MAG: ketose 1,6-bisphosphate aldolase [Anaerolineales bacterium]|nr:ketose 1,6-bisphosphate aldolase [Anaerolineales bacterium]
MTLVNLKTILEKARRGGYAVGAFNVIDLTFLEAILDAAQKQNSPVILNIAEVHFPFLTLENIVPAAVMLAGRLPVETVLNLDHGLTIEAIHRAVDLGFTSVMFDGSHLDFAENVHQTREVVRYCRPRGVSVEAELGAVGGEEGGGLVGSADPERYTDAGQAREFVRKTGIDALAVAIGNSHGKYKGAPHLDFERLADIREAAGLPLVLHGGSGLSAEDFRRAVLLGIVKINFFTGMSQAAIRTAQDCLQQGDERYNDYPAMVRSVRNAVGAVVEEQMILFGSAGQG